jgi:hypothetical protein
VIALAVPSSSLVWPRIPGSLLVRHSQRKRGEMDRPNLRSNGASPRPYRAIQPAHAHLKMYFPQALSCTIAHGQTIVAADKAAKRIFLRRGSGVG